MFARRSESSHRRLYSPSAGTSGQIDHSKCCRPDVETPAVVQDRGYPGIANIGADVQWEPPREVLFWIMPKPSHSSPNPASVQDGIKPFQSVRRALHGWKTWWPRSNRTGCYTWKDLACYDRWQSTGSRRPSFSRASPFPSQSPPVSSCLATSLVGLRHSRQLVR
jgi:hypothetical protein